MTAVPLYMIPKELLPEIDHYLAIGGNLDAPGYLMEYLVNNHTVRGWQIPGKLSMWVTLLHTIRRYRNSHDPGRAYLARIPRWAQEAHA